MMLLLLLLLLLQSHPHDDCASTYIQTEGVNYEH
jgi:hypothetical protein